MTTWQVVVHTILAGGHEFKARPPLFLRDSDNVARLLEYYQKRDPLRSTYYVRVFAVGENAELTLIPEEYQYV